MPMRRCPAPTPPHPSSAQPHRHAALPSPSPNSDLRTPISAHSPFVITHSPFVIPRLRRGYTACGICQPAHVYSLVLDLVRVYTCLADPTRLRLLHLLAAGPLCVCHFQAILREPQVKISKYLAFLRRHHLVAGERSGHWMIYRLTEPRPAPLADLLALATHERTLSADAARRLALCADLGPDAPACVRLTAPARATRSVRLSRPARTTHSTRSRLPKSCTPPRPS